MDNITVRDISVMKLEECINELRDILNELCARDYKPQEDKERLIVSQRLDGMIVEYMKRMNLNTKVAN